MEKFGFKQDVTADQLLDAVRCIHEMSVCNIKKMFGVQMSFYDRDSYTKYIVDTFSPKEIVEKIEKWHEARVFNKDDIVLNFASQKLYIITYIDEHKIKLIGYDGDVQIHDANSFCKWFTKTGNKCKLEKFLMKSLKGEGE